jgi:hypothetical protein
MKKGYQMAESTEDKTKLAGEASFQYQLDLLKREVEIIDNAIARIDGITQNIKNWALVIWIGVITVALSDPDLRRYIIYSGVIPMSFWLLNARWSYFSRGFIYREAKISEFLNSDRLRESFQEQRLIGLKVLDPAGVQYRKTHEYQRTVNYWRALKYPEVYIFYLGLLLISVLAGLFFILA